MADMRKLEADKDIKVLAAFIEIYCDRNHSSEDKIKWTPSKEFQSLGELPLPVLCSDCIDPMYYSARRRKLCPLDPKPTCRNCEIHCYSGENRDKIREVMRFSGRPYLRRVIARGWFREIWAVLTHLF